MPLMHCLATSTGTANALLNRTIQGSNHLPLFGWHKWHPSCQNVHAMETKCMFHRSVELRQHQLHPSTSLGWSHCRNLSRLRTVCQQYSFWCWFFLSQSVHYTKQMLCKLPRNISGKQHQRHQCNWSEPQLSQQTICNKISIEQICKSKVYNI